MAVEQYLDAPWTVAYPTLRIALGGATTKSPEGRTTFSHFKTVLTDDTYQDVRPSTTLTLQGIPGRDIFTLKVSIQNRSSLNIVDWDLITHTHLFPGTPAYGSDSTSTSWSGNPNPSPQWNLTAGPLSGVWWDGNKWFSFGCEDLSQPIAFNWTGRFTPAGPHWYLYMHPTSGSGGETWCQYPIAAGTIFSSSFTWRWFPNATSKPSAQSVAPQAYRVQAIKYPLLVNKTKYPDCLAIGSVFLTSTPDPGTNNGVNAPLTTLSAAVTLPAAGANFTAVTVTTNGSIVAGGRVGLAANMTDGHVVGPTFAVQSVNGTTVTLKNDDRNNPAAGTVIAAGVNVFRDWSYNPRRWGNNPTWKIVNPATGNLFAQAGDYSGITTLRDAIKSTLQFATDSVISRVGSGTLIPQSMSGYNPALYTGTGRPNPFGGVGLICWDVFYGGEWPQETPSYLGESYNAVTPGQIGFIPEVAYTDLTWTTQLISTWADAMGRARDGTVIPGFIKGIGLRGSYLLAGSGAKPLQFTYSTVGDLTFGNPGNLTIPAPFDHSVHMVDAALKVKTLCEYGFNATYWDSWGPNNTPASAYNSVVLRCMVNYAKNAFGVDLLLVPESYSRDDVYSASCPFLDANPARAMYNTREGARAVWPQASGTVRWGNYSSPTHVFLYPQGDGRTNATDFALTVTRFKKAMSLGSHFMAQCVSGTPNEFQMMANIVNQIGLGQV